MGHSFSKDDDGEVCRESGDDAAHPFDGHFLVVTC